MGEKESRVEIRSFAVTESLLWNLPNEVDVRIPSGNDLFIVLSLKKDDLR